MRLNQSTDYALRVLIYAALSPDQRVSIRNISTAYNISRHHLMKVVSRLSGCGYLDTRSGPGGGLKIKPDPAEINVGKVVRDLEPDMWIVECLSPQGRCVISPACRLKGCMDEARAAFVEVLDRYSLADLIGNPEQLRPLLAIETIS